MTQHILIIDDEPSMLDIFSQFLEPEGFSVTTAVNGKEGLRKMEERIPDLVITDIMMPEMNGLEVIRAIRKNYRDLPIIAISGGMTGTEIDFLPQIRMFGACCIIPKPVSFTDLLSAVNGLLLK